MYFSDILGLTHPVVLILVIMLVGGGCRCSSVCSSCFFRCSTAAVFSAAVAAVLCCFCMPLCNGSHMGRGIKGLRNQLNNLTSRDLACETGGNLTYHDLPFHQLDVENYGKPILCNTVDNM